MSNAPAVCSFTYETVGVPSCTAWVSDATGDVVSSNPGAPVDWQAVRVIEPPDPCWFLEPATIVPFAPVTKNTCPPPEPPVYFADRVRSFARELFEAPDEEPVPAPDQYNRQSSAIVRVPPVPGLWLVAVEPSLATDEGEPFPDPAPYKNRRSPPLPVFVAVPCPLVFEPPLYCEESTGLFRSELLPAPELDEPAPEPELLGSAKPPALELPLPVGAEPAPEPELLGSARSPALELPLPVGDEPIPEPELLGSARPVD